MEAVDRYSKDYSTVLDKREAFKDIGNAISNMGVKKGAVDTCHREINVDQKNLEASTNFGFALTKAAK